MKKFFAISLALVLAFSLCACGESEEETTASVTETSAETETAAETEATETVGETVGLANPMVEYETIDEINAEVGCKLVRVEDASDEAFYVIGGYLAQYSFTYNGAEYNLRAAEKAGDISGIYDTEGYTLGMGKDDGEAVSPEAAGIGGYWARWFDGEMQYCVYSAAASAEDFLDVYAAISGGTVTSVGGDDVQENDDNIDDEDSGDGKDISTPTDTTETVGDGDEG